MTTTFKFGADGKVEVARELKDVEFKTSDEDKKLLDFTKAEIRSRLQAPLQREYQNAMAQLDPVGTLNKRFAAQQKAITASGTAVDAFVTSALEAGTPMHEIQARAAQIAGSYLGINSNLAELAAPSSLTTKLCIVLALPVWVAVLRHHVAELSPSRQAASASKD
jgi:hypothetical protein